MMSGYWGSMMGVGSWFGPIWMVVWWGGLLALIVWGVARLTQRGTPGTSAIADSVHGPSAASSEGARAILDRRFAAGEINAEAYAQARRLLEEPVVHA